MVTKYTWTWRMERHRNRNQKTNELLCWKMEKETMWWVLREEFLFGTGDVGKKEIALSDSTGCQVLVDATRKKISKSQLSICGSQGHRSHMWKSFHGILLTYLNLIVQPYSTSHLRYCDFMASPGVKCPRYLAWVKNVKNPRVMNRWGNNTEPTVNQQ